MDEKEKKLKLKKEIENDSNKVINFMEEQKFSEEKQYKIVLKIYTILRNRKRQSKDELK